MTAPPVAQATQTPRMAATEPAGLPLDASAAAEVQRLAAPDDPDMRMATIATRPLTPRAEAAHMAFGEACDAAERTLRLAPGDMAILDNRVTAHGRTAFRPRYDGADRWVQRTFVIADLRRPRDHRPQEGYVISRPTRRPARV